MWKSLTIWLILTSCAWCGMADVPHPRLWMQKAEEAAVRERIARDPLAARLHALVMAGAEHALLDRTCRYEIPDGKRLLGESRRALNQIMHCAWAWRIEGREEYRLRVVAELEAACKLQDWNPSHFLDVAEMATAVATGYDWLYDTLTPEQRRMCEQAIIGKCLKPAKAVMNGKAHWSKPRNNWAQVCGSGIALAAAAVAGADEGLSEDLFNRGLLLVESCNAFYQPDGMYPEGPGYWHYGTNYHVMLLTACKTLGMGISDPQVLRKAGEAIMHLTGPSLTSFNFADSSPRMEFPSPAQCWIASQFGDTVQARHVRDVTNRILEGQKDVRGGGRYSPLGILWLPGQTTGAERPKAAVFGGEQAVASFRSSWTREASWLAIKGGTPAASHGHMDVGSFIYEAHGLRWVHDLGSDNYNLPAYFGNRRWDYHRLQNRSHNTLEIGGRLQNPESKPCPLVASTLDGDIWTATFDLTDAYSASAGKVIRSVRFDPASGATLLADEISEPAGDVVWRIMTDAAVEIRGHEVALKKKNRSIILRRVSAEGVWSVGPAKPSTAAENQNDGFQIVNLMVPKTLNLRIKVEIQP